MQGFNMGRYVPPEHEGTISANKLAGKHALGARANKIRDGILTVRFEMPFAIWCDSCPPETIIGQGVRFNAEKKKVGNYHSTPIYSFRMRHPACGGWIEIRTDPQNTEYVVTEGARKRDYGEWKDERDELGMVKVLTKEERQKRRENAFAMLEGKAQDKLQAKTDADRIKQLKSYSNKSWEDPYTQNQKLRAHFRPGRKSRQQKAAETEQIRDRYGLGIDLLEETEDDAKRARLVEFGSSVDGEETAMQATRRPLFQGPASKSKDKSGPAKGRKDKPRASDVLAATLQSNTRAITDPFLADRDKSALAVSAGHAIPGLKRKRRGQEDESVTRSLLQSTETNDMTDTNDDTPNSTIEMQAAALVAYDSGDD